MKPILFLSAIVALAVAADTDCPKENQRCCKTVRPVDKEQDSEAASIFIEKDVNLDNFPGDIAFECTESSASECKDHEVCCKKISHGGFMAIGCQSATGSG